MDIIENDDIINEEGDNQLESATPVTGLYENWFLDYASYVILERAVPAIEDGFKPVQRRILHAMKEMDDGRFNKVANIIGQTMQYHPHGDASIGDALVNLGQKELLIECQGNWGDIRTGDSAAAPRYIEARLSKFASEVVFNAKTTNWQLSYDGRKKEPIVLPVKFPLLLAQGADGIAVGLATKILPHNFIELIKASIDYLKGKKFELLPDFPTGGYIDASNYNHGMRGGKIRVRAKIEELDKKTLAIKEIPYSTTTSSLIDSILKANDQGKIKIKKVIDNTAKDVEVQIQLAPGVSSDITIDALYAFTDCEVSISPNTCVIVNEKPLFLPVEEVLKISTDQTVELLKKELEIRLNELNEAWHLSSLEKIFIENKIYRNIEDAETWEEVLSTIDKGLAKFKSKLRREVTEDDLVRLTEIKIKRISKFDSFKADEYIKGLEEEIEKVNFNLENLVDYAIKYFDDLLKKFGKGRERKAELKAFDTIQAQMVAVANQKLYVNRAEGFVGYGLKKDEYISDCSDLDDIIVFRKNGTFKVSKISDKAFFGKDIIHVDVYRKTDDRMTYNLVYSDGENGISYVKRFQVKGITRDKDYDLTQGKKGSKVLYFSANPNSEAEIVNVQLSIHSKARRLNYDFDFASIGIKGRNSKGNIFSRYLVKAIKFKEKGISTLGGRDIWFDETIGRLNHDERGKFLGNFDTSDQILVVYKDGNYELTNFDITNHYDIEKIALIEKFRANRPLSVIYYDAQSKFYYVKRFLIETTTEGKKFLFIPEFKGNQLIIVSSLLEPKVILRKGKKKNELIEETVNLSEFIDVKGWKSVGNRLGGGEINEFLMIEEEDVEEEIELEDNSEDEGVVNSEEFNSDADPEDLKKKFEEVSLLKKGVKTVEIKQNSLF